MFETDSQEDPRATRGRAARQRSRRHFRKRRIGRVRSADRFRSRDPVTPDRPKAVELFQRLGRFQIGIAGIDLQLIASGFVDTGLIFFH